MSDKWPLGRRTPKHSLIFGAPKRDVRAQGCRIAKPTRNRRRFSSIPTASGAITRAAYAKAVQAGLDVEPLLKASGLSVRQVENSNFRIAVKNQIRFLNLVADALSDEFLGHRKLERYQWPICPFLFR